MKVNYYKEYSSCLDRDMEFQVYGHGGRPCLVFPSQDGRFFDFADNGMVDSCRDWVEQGQLQFFCCDSIDKETWSDRDGDGRRRIEQHERWYDYIIDELVPRIREINGLHEGIITTGCSMGGAHASNFFFRRPDVFTGVISLSGLYEAHYFFDGYMDDLVYQNSPVDYLRNMPQDHPFLSMYHQSDIILCVGQGDWEDDMIASTCAMEEVLQEKGIAAWIDYWGYDVAHDWPWWQKQLPYFMEQML